MCNRLRPFSVRCHKNSSSKFLRFRSHLWRTRFDCRAECSVYRTIRCFSSTFRRMNCRETSRAFQRWRDELTRCTNICCCVDWSLTWRWASSPWPRYSAVPSPMSTWSPCSTSPSPHSFLLASESVVRRVRLTAECSRISLHSITHSMLADIQVKLSFHLVNNSRSD